MDTYIKIIDGNIVEAPQNYNGIINYNLDEDLMRADGWKPLIPAIVPPETEIRMYHFDYEEKTNEIDEIVVFDETQEEAIARKARVEKERKTDEINNKISELETMSQYDIIFGNEENIKCYQDVIKGLEETRDNL